MNATILYKTDHHHSYASRDLIGVFTSRKTLYKCIRKVIKDNQWNNPRELDTKAEVKDYINWNISFFMEKGQTQGLSGFELDSYEIELNRVL